MNERENSFIIAAFILLVSFIWIVFSYFEMTSYNKLTGKQVSLIDAMVLELRIQEQIK